MKTKGRWGLLAITIALLVFASVAAAQSVQIRYGFWGNPAAIGVERDIIDAFHEQHPDIQVVPVAVGYGDYHQGLLTQIAGGMAPDVMRIDSYFFTDFMHANALLDITDLIERDGLDMSLYYQAGLGDSMSDGRYFGLPWGTAPLYMVLNTPMFADAGIEVPGPDWTWDEFVTIIEALGQGEGTQRQFGFASPLSITGLLPFFWGEGADLFDETRNEFGLTDPNAIVVLERFVDLLDRNLIPDPANFPSGDVLTRWMINDVVGMIMASAQEILSLQNVDDFEFIVLPMPGGRNVRNTTIYKSNTVAISATSPNIEAAWTFLKFLRGPGLEGEKLYMEARRIPPTFDVPELWDIFADSTRHPYNIVEISQLISEEYAHLLPLRPGWNEIASAVDVQLQRIFSGQADPAAAMQQAAPTVREIIERTNL